MSEEQFVQEVFVTDEDGIVTKKVIFPRGIATYCLENNFEVLVVEDGELWGYEKNDEEASPIPYYNVEEEPRPDGGGTVTPFKKKH